MIKMYFMFTGQAILELGKEKSSMKQVEQNTTHFLKSLGIVESKLSEQINYLTQVSTGMLYDYCTSIHLILSFYHNIYLMMYLRSTT